MFPVRTTNKTITVSWGLRLAMLLHTLFVITCEDAPSGPYHLGHRTHESRPIRPSQDQVWPLKVPGAVTPKLLRRSTSRMDGRVTSPLPRVIWACVVVQPYQSLLPTLTTQR